jgi:hypothetical protein
MSEVGGAWVERRWRRVRDGVGGMRGTGAGFHAWGKRRAAYMGRGPGAAVGGRLLQQAAGRRRVSRPGPQRVSRRSKLENAERDSSWRKPEAEILEMEQTESAAESAEESAAESAEESAAESAAESAGGEPDGEPEMPKRRLRRKIRRTAGATNSQYN